MYNSCCRKKQNKKQTLVLDEMFLWNDLFKLTASHNRHWTLSRPHGIANKLSCGQGAFQVTSLSSPPNNFFCAPHGITTKKVEARHLNDFLYRIIFGNKPCFPFINTAYVSAGGLQREFCFIQSQKALRHQERESGWKFISNKTRSWEAYRQKPAERDANSANVS